MFELSAQNDNVVLIDKRNQKRYVLDNEDVDQLIDNNNKLKSDEIVEKYLKFKTEPIVVQQQLKTADIKAEYEAMRDLYEPKVSTRIIDLFIDKFKLDNSELRKLEAFPDSKTIDSFNRDETTKNNMKKEFKLMVEKLKKDTNIKTDPFLYMKFYFGTKIVKKDNAFIQEQLSNLLKEPWKYADPNYVTPEEINRLKQHAPYKKLSSFIFSVQRPVFDGINFMKIMTLLKIYYELQKNYFNNNIEGTNRYKSIFTDYNKNDKYLNFNIWSIKNNKPDNKKISFSVKNQILYILNIKHFDRVIKKQQSFKKYINSITPKIYALIKYLLISQPSANQYKVTINLFGDFNDIKSDETIFSDDYLIYKIEKINDRVEKQQQKNKNTLWDNRIFEQTINDFKEYVRISDTERRITQKMTNLFNYESSDSSQSDDTSDDTLSTEEEIKKLYIEKTKEDEDKEKTKKDESKEKTKDETKDESKEKTNDEIWIEELEKQGEEYHNQQKEERKKRNQEKIEKMKDKLIKEDLKTDFNDFGILDSFTNSMKNAEEQDKINNNNKLQQQIFEGYLNQYGDIDDTGLESEGRLKLFSAGWTDNTLTRIEELLKQLKQSSGFNIPRQHYALGWTDDTLTRIDALLEQLKN